MYRVETTVRFDKEFKKLDRYTPINREKVSLLTEAAVGDIG